MGRRLLHLAAAALQVGVAVAVTVVRQGQPSENVDKVLRPAGCNARMLLNLTFVEHLKSLPAMPKLIHVTWKRRDLINSSHPVVQHGIKKLRDLNPDWTLKVWDDDDVLNYMKEKLTPEDYKATIKHKFVEKSDLWRLMIMYYEGGLYQDIDRLVNIPLSRIIQPDTKMVLPTYGDENFAQDFMCSSPGNEIFRRAIEMNIRERNNHRGVYFLGPVTYFYMVTEVVWGYGYSFGRFTGHTCMPSLRQQLSDMHVSTYNETPPCDTMLHRPNEGLKPKACLDVLGQRPQLFAEYHMGTWYKDGGNFDKKPSQS